MTDEIDAVYNERNRCVAALTAMAERLGWSTWRGLHAPADDDWDPEWRNVIFINLPTGQVSWHIHDRDLVLFARLPLILERPWDGHTTEQKYVRLERLTQNIRYCVRCGVDMPPRPFAPVASIFHAVGAVDFIHLLCDQCGATAAALLSPAEIGELHRQERHPEWEYATTQSPRKGEVTMPAGEGWEHNPKIWNGSLFRSWDRDDVADYVYWRRRKGKRCQHCGCLLTEGPTARDKDRYQRSVCGGCQ